MNLDQRIKEQEGRVERAELKWERARQLGQTARARLWEIQYECECEALDELYVEQMQKDFEEAMSRAKTSSR